MKYFKNCKTKEQLKREYKRLCRENHPDLGGTVEAMQQINAEYDALIKVLPDEVSADQEENKQDENFEIPAELVIIVNELKGLEGLEISVIGHWVWVTGDTYSHKDKLKEMGFKWASKKKQWYYTTPEFERHNKRSKETVEDLKNRFKHADFAADKKMRIAV